MEEKGQWLLNNVVKAFGLLPVLSDPKPFYYGTSQPSPPTQGA